MLDEAYHWAETQFGAADLGDARRTDRLVSTMAAIARAPDESLPRQLGSVAGAKAAYRLFDCGAVTREAVMDPHLAQCRAAAAQHPIVLMVQDDTTLDFSSHRRLRGAGRVGDDRGTGSGATHENGKQDLTVRQAVPAGATHENGQQAET